MSFPAIVETIQATVPSATVESDDGIIILPPAPEEGDRTAWCRCGNCRLWPRIQSIEMRCCRTRHGSCVLEDEELRTIVLRESVVRTAVSGREILFARRLTADKVLENRQMRHQAYKQYVYFQVGRTGSGNRVVSFGLEIF